ncbi:hypothetical protein GCM10010435_17090 [Winogradskya consettensis]|uniref:PPE family domain-containing protein n=1 Tax=Winogradskya consettensis TaxID=113560 RepID=A0A919SUC9_9ACTN|nr:hypothetical protein [Actinoplanes consettensis]GIM78736.1 hypothetical protein Aco04nite_61960 [Actinoplanes consettensis]
MTDWNSYNTPRLWSMVANEDNSEAWRQVAAWGDMSDSVKDQRGLLINAREKLIAIWPPEENASSEAFVKKLNSLLDRMDVAKAEAMDTAVGMGNILDALRHAKENIEPLYEQHYDKSHDIVPAWWDSAEDEIDQQARSHMMVAEAIVQENVGKIRIPEPYSMDIQAPRGGETETETSNGGDSSSTGTSTRIGTPTSIKVPHNPPPPTPGGPGDDPSQPTDGTGPGSNPPTSGNPPGSSNPPGSTTPIDSGNGGPGGGGGGGTVPTTGPGLSGVITPPAATNPGVAPPGGTLPPSTGVIGGGGGIGGGGVITPGVLPGAGPVTGGTGGRGTPIRGGGTIGGSGLTGEGVGGAGRVGGVGAGGVGGVGRGGVRPGGARAMPSGAVIGESVGGSGRGVAGGARGGVGGAAGRGVAGERAGGVGGRGGAGGVNGRAGARGAGGMTPEQVRNARPARPSWLPPDPEGKSSSMMSGGRGAGRRSNGDSSEQPFDPDNPWQVAEGVDPVIAPGSDGGYHDPGPNVIGWR